MYRWHLITHNLHAFASVTARLKVLGVEYYSPEMMEVKKRRDCNGVRYLEKPLFPGYLFVRLDPEIVHTSTVSEIPGFKEFVSFGGPICTIRNEVIAALKQSLLLRTDQKVTSIECRNVPSSVMSALAGITLIKSKVERQVALFELLKAESGISGSVSVIERPQVNEKIR